MRGPTSRRWRGPPSPSRSPTGSSGVTRSGTQPVAAALPEDLRVTARLQRRRPPRVPGHAPHAVAHPAGLAHRGAGARRHLAGHLPRRRGRLRHPLEVPRRHQPGRDRGRSHPRDLQRRSPGPDAVHARHLGRLRGGRRHQRHPRRHHGRRPLPGRQQRGCRHRPRAVPLQPEPALRAGGALLRRPHRRAPARLPRLLPLGDLVPHRPGRRVPAGGLRRSRPRCPWPTTGPAELVPALGRSCRSAGRTRSPGASPRHRGCGSSVGSARSRRSPR